MTCQSPRCRPAAWTCISTSLPVGAGWSMSASSRTSAEPYRSWTMAFIVVSRPVTGLCPWPATTAVTGSDVAAFGASMVVLSSIGRWTRPRDQPADPPQRRPAGLRCWVGAVGGQGAGQGLVQRGGVDVQLGGDLGAVDDEGFLELVLQLEQFPDRGVGDAQGSQEECWGAAEFGFGLAGQPVDDLDQLARGPGVGVVGEVPDLARGLGVFAEGGEAFADVGQVGVGVGLVGVAQDSGGLAGQGGRDDPVAQHRLGAAAGTEVVRGPADDHLDVAGLVGGQELAGHAGPQCSFLGVGGIGAGLGQGLAAGAAVHVDVLHADQAGPLAWAAARTLAWRAGNSSAHCGRAG